jgi:hypothetical protein
MNAHHSPSLDVEPRSEALHLPVSGLFADLDLGYGAVALTDELASLPAGLRLRILRDWSSALKSEADRALVEMFHASSATDGSCSIVQQVERFKRSCKADGIHCPSDFAVLLQQV